MSPQACRDHDSRGPVGSGGNLGAPASRCPTWAAAVGATVPGEVVDAACQVGNRLSLPSLCHPCGSIPADLAADHVDDEDALSDDKFNVPITVSP